MPNDINSTGGVPQSDFGGGNPENFRIAQDYNRLIDPHTDFDNEYRGDILNSDIDYELDLDSWYSEGIQGFYNGLMQVLEGIADAPAAIGGMFADEGSDWEKFWSGWTENVDSFFDAITFESNDQLIARQGSQRQKDSYGNSVAFSVGEGFGQFVEQLLIFVPGLNVARIAKLGGTAAKVGKAVNAVDDIGDLAKLTSKAVDITEDVAQGTNKMERLLASGSKLKNKMFGRVSQTGSVIEPLSKTGSTLNFVQKNQGLLSVVNGALQQWPMAYEEAKNSGLSNQDATIMANLISGVVGMSEKAGLDYFGKVISSGASKGAAKSALKKSLAKLSKDDLKDGLTRNSLKKVMDGFNKSWSNNLRSRGTKALQGFSGEATQEFSQTYIEDMLKTGYDLSQWGDNKIRAGQGAYGANFTSEDTFKEAVFAGLVGGIVGGTTTSLMSGRDGNEKEAIFHYLDMAAKKGKKNNNPNALKNAVVSLKQKVDKKLETENSMVGSEEMSAFIDEVADFVDQTQDLETTPTERFKHYSRTNTKKVIEKQFESVNENLKKAEERNDGTDVYFRDKTSQIGAIEKQLAEESKQQMLAITGKTKYDTESKASFEKRLEGYTELSKKVVDENLSTEEFYDELEKLRPENYKSKKDELLKSAPITEKYHDQLRDLALDKDKNLIDKLITKEDYVGAFELAYKSATLNPDSQEQMNELVPAMEADLAAFKEEQKKKKEEEKESQKTKDTESEESKEEKKSGKQPSNKNSEVISDDDYNKFVEFGVVSDSIIKDIANRIKNGETLSERQRAIHAEKTKEVEDVLKESQQSKKKKKVKAFKSKISKRLRDLWTPQRGSGDYYALDKAFGDKENTTEVEVEYDEETNLDVTTKEGEDTYGKILSTLPTTYNFEGASAREVKDYMADLKAKAILDAGYDSLTGYIDNETQDNRELVLYDESIINKRIKEFEDKYVKQPTQPDINQEFEKIPGSRKRGVKNVSYIGQRADKRNNSKPTINTKKDSNGAYEYTSFEGNTVTEAQKAAAEHINNARKGIKIELDKERNQYKVTHPDGRVEYKERTTKAIGERQQYVQFNQDAIDQIESEMIGLDENSDEYKKKQAEIDSLKSWGTDAEMKSALSIGTTVDTYIRDVLIGNHDQYNSESNIDNSDYEKLNEVEDLSGNKVGQVVTVTKEAKKEINTLFNWLKDNGFVVIADGVNVVGENVTGELDLLLIDPNGNYHILDMKSYKNKGGSVINDFLDAASKYNLEGDIQELSKAQNYMAQQFIYKRNFEQQFGVPVNSVMLAPISVTYKRDGVVHPKVTGIDIRNTVVLTEDGAPKGVIKIVDQIAPSVVPYLPPKKTFNQLQNMGEQKVYESLLKGEITESEIERHISENPQSKMLRKALDEYRNQNHNVVNKDDLSNVDDVDDPDVDEDGNLYQRNPDVLLSTSVTRSEDPDTWNTVMDHFNKLYPDVPVELVSDAAWKYGPDAVAVVSEAGVMINKDRAFQSSIAHEVAHIYVDFMKSTDPKVIERGIKLVEGTGFDTWAQENYPELSRQEQLEEALVEMLGSKSVNDIIVRTKYDKKLIDKVLEFLQDFWNTVKARFGNGDAQIQEMVRDLTTNRKNVKFEDVRVGKFRSQKSTVNTQRIANLNQAVQKIFIQQSVKNIVRDIKVRPNATNMGKVVMKYLYNVYQQGPTSKTYQKLFGDMKIMPEQITEVNYATFYSQLRGNSSKDVSEFYNQIIKTVENQTKTQIDQDRTFAELFDSWTAIERSEDSEITEDPERGVKGKNSIDRSVLELMKNLVDDNGNPLDMDVVYEVMSLFPDKTTRSGYRKALKEFIKNNTDSHLGYTATKVDNVLNYLNTLSKKPEFADRAKALEKKTMAIFSNSFIPNYVSLSTDIKNTNRFSGYQSKNISRRFKSEYNNIYKNLKTLNWHDFSNLPGVNGAKKIKDLTPTSVGVIVARYMGHTDFVHSATGTVLPISDIIKNIGLTNADVKSIKTLLEEYRDNPNLSDAGIKNIQKKMYRVAREVSEAVNGTTKSNKFYGQKFERRSAVQNSNSISRFVHNFEQVKERLNWLRFKDAKGHQYSPFSKTTRFSYAESLGTDVNGQRNSTYGTTSLDRQIESLLNNVAGEKFVSLGQLNDRKQNILIGIDDTSYKKFQKDMGGDIGNRKHLTIINAAVKNIPEGLSEDDYNKAIKRIQSTFNENFNHLSMEFKNGKPVLTYTGVKMSEEAKNLLKAVYENSSTEAEVEAGNNMVRVLMNKFGVKGDPNDGKTKVALTEAITKELNTQAEMRFFLRSMIGGNILEFKDTTAFTKRIGGSKTAPNKTKEHDAFTIVIDTNLGTKENPELVTDSFKIINDNYYSFLEDDHGKGNIGPNMKDNVNEVDDNGQLLYIKNATVTQEGLRNSNQMQLANVINDLTKEIAKKEGIPETEVKLQVIDSDSLKGTHNIQHSVIPLSELSSAAKNGAYKKLKIRSHGVVFNINTDYSNKPNKAKRVGAPIQLIDMVAVYDSYNGNDASEFSNMLIDKLKDQSQDLWEKLQSPEKLLALVSSGDLDFLSTQQRETFKAIFKNAMDNAKDETDIRAAYDHPDVVTVIQGIIRNKISEKAIKIDTQGFQAQLVPDFGENADPSKPNDREYLKYNAQTGMAEVAAPWSLFFERQTNAQGNPMTDQEMIRYANERLMENPRSFQMATARVPISGPMSGFAGQVKYFTSGSMNTISVPREFSKYSDADYDGDKLFMLVRDTNENGEVIDGFGTSLVNKMIDTQKSDRYNQDRKVQLEFEDDFKKLKDSIKTTDDSTKYGYSSNAGQFDQSEKMQLQQLGVAVTASMSRMMNYMSLHNMRLKSPININGKSYQKLGIIDGSGNQEFVAKLLQGFLDANNNPIALELGITEDNITETISLAMLGVPPQEIISIINDPNLKEYYENLKAKSSNFTLTESKVKTMEEFLRSKSLMVFSGYQDRYSLSTVKGQVIGLNKTEEVKRYVSDNAGLIYRDGRGSFPISVDGKFYMVEETGNDKMFNVTAQLNSLDEFMSALPGDRSDMKNILEYYQIENVSASINQLRDLMTAKKETSVTGVELIKRLNYLKKLKEGKSGIDVGTAMDDPMLGYLQEVNAKQLNVLKQNFVTEGELAINFSTNLESLTKKGLSKDDAHAAMKRIIQKSMFVDVIMNSDVIPESTREMIKAYSVIDNNTLGSMIERRVVNIMKTANRGDNIDPKVLMVAENIMIDQGKISIDESFKDLGETKRREVIDAFESMSDNQLGAMLYAYSLSQNTLNRGGSSVSALFPFELTDQYLSDMNQEIMNQSNNQSSLFHGMDGNEYSPIYSEQNEVVTETDGLRNRRNYHLRINSAVENFNDLKIGSKLTEKNKKGNFIDNGDTVNLTGDYANYLKKSFAFKDNDGNLYVKEYSADNDDVYKKVPNEMFRNSNGRVKYVPLSSRILTSNEITELKNTCR